jgi:DNA repair exonuclease SbcCD ATPase subunit
VLFAHGATDGEELGVGQLASGLTWTIPGARLQRWGRCFLGHVHRPSRITENVWSVGGIANWTFSDRAEQFRALVLDTDTLEVSEIPLLRVLVPIEFELDGDEAHDEILGAFPVATLKRLTEIGVNLNTDTVSLKIKARLPQHEMALVPKAEELQEAINSLVERPLIHNCIITRETTGLHKARLTTEQSAREMTLDQMLDLYVETTGNGTQPETVVAAKDRIDRIADYYKPGGGTFGFEPVTLSIENFRQWGTARLDFADLTGAVSVWGENESGKTNLLEAIMFALFKRTPTSTGTIEDELRLGATSGSVVLTFNSRGATYLLRRAMERGRGGVSCKSELLAIAPVHYVQGGDIIEGDTMTPVCETAGDIDKRIVELVGSYEFFLSTVFRAGRDLNRLIVATPAIWHKIFGEALNLDCYEPLRKHASENATNAALRANEAGILIGQLKEQIDDETAALNAIDFDDLVCRIAGLAKQIADAEAGKVTLDGERSALIDRRAALRTAANTRANLETSIREAKRALATITIEDIGARPAVPTVDIAVLESEAANLKTKREALMEADAAKRKELATASGEVAVHEDAAKRIAREIEALGRQIEAHEATQGELKGPPCRQALHVVGTPMEENCPAWLYYSKADQGKELREKLENARARETAEIHYAGTASAKHLGVKGELAPIAADIAAIGPTLRLLETKIGDYRNASHAAELWDEKRKSAAKADEQRDGRICEVHNLEAKLAALADNGAEISETLLAIERTENRIGAQDGIIKAARAAVAGAEADVAKRSHIAEAITKLEASIAKHAGDSEKHAADQRAWGLIAEAFHHTGVPYLLLERVIGGFEKTANELLDGTGMTVQVQTVNNTKKGDARDKLTVLFTDDRGQHSISQASGEQGTLLSIVLSASLSITGSMFWGAVPSLYVQDEGWGTLDEPHLEIARELISRIAARFARFIYITHTRELAESADVQLRVSIDNGASRLVG